MLKRSNKLMALFSLLVIAAVMLAACTPATATEAPQPTAVPPTAVPPTAVPPTAVPPTEEPTEVPVVELKIAFLGPITGPAASLGTEQLAFARVAVVAFNTLHAGKYHATLVEEDTDITPDKATPVCQKDADDQTILGIVGPAGSGQVEACAQILEDAGLVHVSGSATRPSLAQQGNKTFFRVVPNDDVQSLTDATYIAETIGAKTVYVIDDQESYGTNLADSVDKVLKEKGVKTERASVSQQDNDFSALVTKIKASNAELVFMAGQVPSQGALLAKQLKEQGVDIPVFGGDGFYSQTDYIDGAGGATEGSYASVFFPDIRAIQDPQVALLIAAADQAFPAWGNFGPPTGIAALVILEAAVRANEAGQLDRAGVLAEVAQTDADLFGLHFKFDETGEVAGAAFVISQVENGKFTQVFP